MLPYDPLPFVDPDTEGIHCRVSLTLPNGEVRCASGVFLHQDGDQPRLACGIYDTCEALGLPEPSDEECLTVSAVVDKQLALRPQAVVTCPELTIRIELVEPNR